MSERRNTRIQAKLLREHLLHAVGMYRVELGIVRALGDDDDSLALANSTLLPIPSLAMPLSAE